MSQFRTDKEMIEMFEFMDAYDIACRFRGLKKENANLKRRLTVLKRKYE